MEYLGKLHETVVKFPQTDIWMDSCGAEELDFGMQRGISGATSNPVIIGGVIKKELPECEKRICRLIETMPNASEDDIAWALMYEISGERSAKLLPVFEKHAGKKGRLSLQTNAKNYRNSERMLEQAKVIHALAPNMQVKIPATAAGIKAMEEATYAGISINATVSYTVPQYVAVAEAVERGLKRRKEEGLDTDKMSPVCTLMLGRLDDWVKADSSSKGMVLNADAANWGGVAVCKEAYRLYKERHYTTRILTAAVRNSYHWSEFIGGDICQTINYSWYKKLNNSDVSVEERMSIPVKEEYLTELMKSEEFRKSFKEDGMNVEEFDKFGAVRDTLSGFIAGYDELCALIRKYMI